MDKMREEFESWFLIVSGVDVFSDRDGDAYKCEDDESTRYLCGIWLSWKASRSSLCVELPKITDFSKDSRGARDVLNFEFAVECVARALNDVGVRHE